ncbi:MAG: polysaccharide biosynthesis tyrosine autokinase [Gammaproteobacteria bacterium]|nr:polysaccharide biosynthesis tyrosine autokinase [Gammaproteobacteria bacterium]
MRMQAERELEKDSIDWQRIWIVVRQRKWAILSLAFVVTLLTALVVYAMTPIYSATALVLIQSRQANIVSIEEIYGVDMRHQNYYNTQAEILKSRPIAAKVIDTVGAPPEVAPSGIRRFSFDWRSLLPFKVPDPPGGSINFDQREADIDNYLKHLSIESVRGTQLVEVVYASADPRQAAAYANAHAAAYIDSILDARLSVTQSASSWMGKRVEELRKNLQNSEAQLQAFREQEKLIDVQGYQALPSLEINDLTARLVNARRRLSGTKIAYLQVYGNESGAIASVPAVLDNSAVQQFRAIQARAEQQVAELGKRYGPKHPKMIAAQSELAEATQNLEAQQRDVTGGIRAEYLAAQAEVAALEADLSGAKQQYQEVSRKGSDLASLQREVETNRQLYELFYTRMRETAQTGDLKSVNARVVQPAAAPRFPSKPNKERAVILAFLLSLLAGVGAALLLEKLNDTIRNSADIEDKVGLPLLGVVPLLTGKSRKKVELALFDDTNKSFGEAIRTIRTGISLSSLDNPHKIILVTSSVGSEGKSTVAMNLALAFAQVERVLLLDADMRRPSVAHNLDLDRSQPGLSELLAHQAGYKDCVKYLEEYKLDVLKTGLIPPDPLEVLSSDAVSRLIKELRQAYDRVIIDSPPILPVSDSAVLSTHADSLVYVIKSDATSIHQIKNGLSQLQRFNAPITGIVVNQLNLRDVERHSDYDHYGGYYDYAESGTGSQKRTHKPQTEAASI